MIKVYEPYCEGGDWESSYATMRENKNGYWVAKSDHDSEIAKLQDRNTELKEQLRDELKYRQECLRSANIEIAKLKEQLKEAEKVIEFYADDTNWVLIRDRPAPNGFYYSCTTEEDEEPMNKYDKDDERVIGGKLARQYLAKKGGE